VIPDDVKPIYRLADSRLDLTTGRLTLELDISVPPEADTEAVASALAELIRALNAHHIALGGNGLIVEDWCINPEAPACPPTTSPR
jgi:hypothetical protein